ncbi:fasciclin-2-like [Lytechinus variegatus]|uniref:fasciclin-2-like n=1 Tax=Lytechinus variegatus TaxID=7654 RepID=UPI001BB194B6|nr:fasciclin-2-like [Lytechinus variegatus]
MRCKRVKMIIRTFLITAFLAKLGDSLIVTPRESYSRFEGDSGFFYKCENPDINGPQPRWEDQQSNAITAGSGRVYVTETESSTECATPDTLCRFTRIHFRNVLSGDAGLYSCQAQGHQTITRNVQIFKNIEFPLYDGDEEEQSLIYNTTSTIYCTARPLDQGMEMFWTKDAGSVGSPTKFIEAFGQLTVKNVEVDDEGEYGCTAHYPETTLSVAKYITVHVQVPPKWAGTLPAQRDVVINSDVTLVCVATGRPDPQVTWTHVMGSDREEITNIPNMYELSSVGNRQLRIINIQLPQDDNGITIECTASNDPLGARTSTAITHTIELNVLVPPVLTQQQIYTVDETAEGGNTRSFECAITNFRSEATLSFRRGGLTAMHELELGSQPDDSRVVVTQNSATGALTLTITNIQREHEGTWTCYAESPAGDVYVDHMLLVEYKPIIDQTRTPLTTVSWVGRLTNLTCVFFGYPLPTVKWTKNNVELIDGLDVTVIDGLPPGTSIIQITPEDEDFGAYFCNGSNTKGFLNHRQELTKAERPSAPVGLRITDVTSSTMSIQFSPPNDDGSLLITGYTIEYKVRTDTRPTILEYESSASDEMTCRRMILPMLTGEELQCTNYCEDSQFYICCPVADRSICLDRPIYEGVIVVHLRGLRAQQTYEVRVAARNELGPGDFSNIESRGTDLFSVPDPPIIISSRESDRRDRYILRWRPPYDDGGSKVNYYHVKYSQSRDKDVTELSPRPVSVRVDGNATSVQLSPLNQGQYYFIELTAESNLGFSDPSYFVIETAGTFFFMTTPPTRPRNAGFWGLFNENTTVIIIIVIVVLIFVFIIVTDVCCYCINDCGLLMFICVTCCGKTAPSTRQEIELGENEYGTESVRDWDSLDEEKHRFEVR